MPWRSWAAARLQASPGQLPSHRSPSTACAAAEATRPRPSSQPGGAPSTARESEQVPRGCSAVLGLLIAVLGLAEAPRALAQTSTLQLVLPISTDSPTGQNIREFARQVAART